jgi:tubulin polyglutamylase TTLL9
MHLTNVAIQKTASNYQSKKGCKLSLQKIKMLMASKHGMPTIDRLFADMQVRSDFVRLSSS